MNRKKLLPLGILAGAAAVLAVLLLALNLLNAEEDQDEGIPLFSIASEDVTALSYQYNELDVSLSQNDDGSWTLASDTLLPIDTDTVNQVLDGLTGMTALRSLADGEGDVDAMGFDSPTMTFAFTAAGTDYTLTVGASNSMTDSYYVRLDDGSLYTVAASAFSTLCRTESELYEPQDITDIESTEVAAMTLDTGAETLHFTRDESGSWTLDDDPGYELDQDVVSRMSSTICSLTTDWSITAPEDDARYGLDTPNAVVTLTATDGRTVRCVFGATDPDDQDVAYLRASNDESVVYEIPANHLVAFAYTRDTLKAATPESATAEDAAD
ncbi:MAG TPA: DUF4340 domain-containing protein [Candidatus Gemmiger faecigallinarum]|nr:DUF4340 domain-containing protein [Candidatus Gemmiger faecigallinarum]